MENQTEQVLSVLDEEGVLGSELIRGRSSSNQSFDEALLVTNQPPATPPAPPSPPAPGAAGGSGLAQSIDMAATIDLKEAARAVAVENESLRMEIRELHAELDHRIQAAKAAKPATTREDSAVGVLRDFLDLVPSTGQTFQEAMIAFTSAMEALSASGLATLELSKAQAEAEFAVQLERIRFSTEAAKLTLELTEAELALAKARKEFADFVNPPAVAPEAPKAAKKGKPGPKKGSSSNGSGWPAGLSRKEYKVWKEAQPEGAVTTPQAAAAVLVGKEHPEGTQPLIPAAEEAPSVEATANTPPPAPPAAPPAASGPPAPASGKSKATKAKK